MQQFIKAIAALIIALLIAATLSATIREMNTDNGIYAMGDNQHVVFIEGSHCMNNMHAGMNPADIQARADWCLEQFIISESKTK